MNAKIKKVIEELEDDGYVFVGYEENSKGKNEKMVKLIHIIFQTRGDE